MRIYKKQFLSFSSAWQATKHSGTEQKKIIINLRKKGQGNKDNDRNTDQETDWAFLMFITAVFIPWKTRGKLGFENELSQLFMVHIFMNIETLWSCIPLIHHLSPSPQLIPHPVLPRIPFHSVFFFLN